MVTGRCRINNPTPIKIKECCNTCQFNHFFHTTLERTMKLLVFLILSWVTTLVSANPGKLDLVHLGHDFTNLTEQIPPVVTGDSPHPLLPSIVSFQKMYSTGQAYMAWLKGTLGQITELVSGSVNIWRNDNGGSLMDLIIIGNKRGRRVLRLDIVDESGFFVSTFRYYNPAPEPHSPSVISENRFHRNMYRILGRDLTLLELPGIPALHVLHQFKQYVEAQAEEGAAAEGSD